MVQALDDAVLQAHAPHIETPAYVYDLIVVDQRFAALAAALPALGIR